MFFAISVLEHTKPFSLTKFFIFLLVSAATSQSCQTCWFARHRYTVLVQLGYSAKGPADSTHYSPHLAMELDSNIRSEMW